MSRITKIVRNKYLILGAFVLLIYSCASMGRPQGGPRDWDPPVYVRSNPSANQLNFKKQRIEIEFDEIVMLEKASEKVIVSPPQKEKEQVRAMGRKVLVTLRDSMQENTTYSIDFSDAIVDNNERNKLENFSLSFSTGPTIDSLQFSGLLINASNLEPITGAFVGLHRNPEDTAFTHQRFDRISSTDAYGRFTIRNVGEGSYKVYALADANRNYFYDQPTEHIAFIDSVFVPSVELHIHRDTIWRDSLTIDTIVDHSVYNYQPNNMVLRMFNEGFANLYLDKYARMERRKLSFEFSALVDQKPLLRPVNFEADSAWYVVEVPEVVKKVPSSGPSSGSSEADAGPKSTFTVWIADSTIYKRDSLLISVSYLRTDSTQQRSLFTDTLKFNFRDPKPAKPKRKSRLETKKKEEEIADSLVVKTDTIVPIQFIEKPETSSGEIELSDRVKVKWKEPIVRFDSAAFRLEVKVDTLWQPFESTLEFDTLGLMTFLLTPTKDYTDSTTYRVVVDSAGVTGVYGLHNAPLTGEFKTKTSDQYCDMLVTVIGVDTTAFIELLDEGDMPKMQSPVVNGECEFWFVPPGKYYMRLVVDTNGDGEWTTGSFADKRQPEEVYYYEGLLEMRANWSLNQEWNIKANPIDKQKPLEITKNLPDEVKARLDEAKKNSKRPNKTN